MEWGKRRGAVRPTNRLLPFSHPCSVVEVTLRPDVRSVWLFARDVEDDNDVRNIVASYNLHAVGDGTRRNETRRTAVFARTFGRGFRQLGVAVARTFLFSLHILSSSAFLAEQTCRPQQGTFGRRRFLRGRERSRSILKQEDISVRTLAGYLIVRLLRCAQESDAAFDDVIDLSVSYAP